MLMMEPKGVPSSVVHPEVVQALLALVKAVNANGPSCVGAVCAVVYENGTQVLPILDENMGLVGGGSPLRALLE